MTSDGVGAKGFVSLSIVTAQTTMVWFDELNQYDALSSSFLLLHSQINCHDDTTTSWIFKHLIISH